MDKPVSTAARAALDAKADTSALATKLNTADLDSQTASKITTNGTATQVALAASYAAKSQVLTVTLTGLSNGDDITAKYAAAESAVVAFGGGGTVQVPGGSYVAAIQMRHPNVRLVANGAVTLKIKDNATQLVDDCPIRVLADNCTVEGVTIDGNRAGNPTLNTDRDTARYADGIAVYASGARILNNTIVEPMGHGIIVWNIAFDDIPAGPREHVWIDGNRVTAGVDGYRAAIDLADNTDIGTGTNRHCVITRNICDGVSGAVAHTGYGHIIANNVFHSGFVAHTGSENCLIANNLVTGGVLGLSGAAIGVTGGAIVGNVVEDPAYISVDHASDVVVSGNKGKVRLANVDRVSVVGNLDEKGGTSNGITVEGTNTHVLIQGCTTAYIAATAAGLTIANNRVLRTKILVTASTAVDIIGNYVTNDAAESDQEGIDVRTTTGVRVAGNHVVASRKAGIRIGGSGAVDQYVVENNIVEGIVTTTLYDIQINSDATNGRILNNTLRGPARPLFIGGGSPEVRGNAGSLTESSGTVTIPNGSSSVSVSHGLGSTGAAVTPSSVTATPRANATVWVGSRSTGSIGLSRSGTSGDVVVDWNAKA